MLVAAVAIVAAVALAPRSADALINWNATSQSVTVLYDEATRAYTLVPGAGSPNTGSGSTTAAPQPGGSTYAVASLSINRTSAAEGWDVVEVAADRAYLARNASVAYYGAGLAEGAYTWDSIADSWFNWGNNVRLNSGDPYSVRWITTHIAYLRSFSADPAVEPQPFRRQVAKFMAWLDGLTRGYNDARIAAAARGVPGASDAAVLDHYDLFLMNFDDEIIDVNQSNPVWINPTCPAPSVRQQQRQLQHFAQAPAGLGSDEHCSALIKATPNDLLVTHTTWASFRTMLRQYKTYHFETSVVLSGYPASLASCDDFYMTGRRLVVTETTNNQFNNSLAQAYVQPHTVSEWLRVMAANVLASSGAEWAKLYVLENSGTYSNQWMVVDMKLVTGDALRRAALPAGTFWLLEQMPGPFSQAADMTPFLNANSYWPSFNRPYFKSVADVSCNTYWAQTFGPIWGYKDYSRYIIFAREHGTVTDVESLKRLIRYNNWSTDPASRIPWCAACNPPNDPALSIAARYDLIPLTQNYSNASAAVRAYLTPHYDGAIDAKITTWRAMGGDSAAARSFDDASTDDATAPLVVLGVTSAIIDGPTNDQQLSFSWSAGSIVPRPQIRGQPDTFNFPWLNVTSRLRASLVPAPARAAQAWTVVIVSGVVVGCMLAFVIVYKTFFDDEEAPSVTEMRDAEAAAATAAGSGTGAAAPGDSRGAVARAGLASPLIPGDRTPLFTPTEREAGATAPLVNGGQ